jgi:hypothetical protein
MANLHPHFSSACLTPPIITPAERVQQLKELLTEVYWQFQKANILKLVAILRCMRAMS